MDEFYRIMDECLDIEKDIASVVFMISRIERLCTEEENESEKYLANATLLLLNEIHNKMKFMVKDFDEQIVTFKCERK